MPVPLLNCLLVFFVLLEVEVGSSPMVSLNIEYRPHFDITHVSSFYLHKDEVRSSRTRTLVIDSSLSPASMAARSDDILEPGGLALHAVT